MIKFYLTKRVAAFELLLFPAYVWPSRSHYDYVCNRYSISILTPLEYLLRLNEIQLPVSVFLPLRNAAPCTVPPGAHMPLLAPLLAATG